MLQIKCDSLLLFAAEWQRSPTISCLFIGFEEFLHSSSAVVTILVVNKNEKFFTYTSLFRFNESFHIFLRPVAFTSVSKVPFSFLLLFRFCKRFHINVPKFIFWAYWQKSCLTLKVLVDLYLFLHSIQNFHLIGCSVWTPKWLCYHMQFNCTVALVCFSILISFFCLWKKTTQLHFI